MSVFGVPWSSKTRDYFPPYLGDSEGRRPAYDPIGVSTISVHEISKKFFLTSSICTFLPIVNLSVMKH